MDKRELVGLVFETDVDTDDIIDVVGTNVRIYANDMGVTMDYIPTRVNVIYNAKTKVILSVDNG